MTQYRSEIRDSELEALAEKVAGDNYKTYLKRIVLRKVRGFTDREVKFDFPVTAVVGPNGGGKSTVLGAAGLIYRSVAPRTFFAKSGKYDASMKDWSIEYDIVDKTLNPRIQVQRVASFKAAKWNRTPVQREVLVFGVSRTIPATERRELTKAAGNRFSAQREVALDPKVIEEVGHILGKSFDGFSRLFVDSAGNVSLLAGTSPKGDAYSEFHFGAGEASVISMVAAIEAADDQALILIEEIENGLHPVATRRMVEYLIHVAKRKACQVIFTTHSNDALAPLPTKAIWSAYDGHVLQGKLDVRALRTITGQVPAKLAIFVEDAFAEKLVTTALRVHGSVEMDSVQIHAMGGADPAVTVNKQHNLDPTATFPSVCLVDGDRKDLVNHQEKVWALPGDMAPDAFVFDRVHSVVDEVAGKLALALQLPFDRQSQVVKVVKDRNLTNRDRHVVFEQIGEDLDFTSASTVANAFLAIWAQRFPDEIASVLSGFESLLPARA